MERPLEQALALIWRLALAQEALPRGLTASLAAVAHLTSALD